MKIGSIECFAGISGDMLLGALIDAGVAAETLQKAAAALGIGAELRVHAVQRGGIRATKVDVLENGVLAEKAVHAAHGNEHEHERKHEHRHELEPEHEHKHGHEREHEPRHTHEHGGHAHGRNWPAIRELIARTELPSNAMKIALRAFELLALAEAKVHGIAPEAVHFHEVGAVDAIVDIVCGAVGLDALGVEKWRCSAVNVGSGFVQCAHGRMPVPAPATAELLQGVPVYSAGPQMELATPTGAAMLRALECDFEEKTPLMVTSIGYGAGGRNPEGFANVLRLSVGTVKTGSERRSFSGDRVVVLECALDDASPQVLAHAMELALEHGALDVMAAPVTMKKGRPGTLLTVLAKPQDEDALEKLLFRETTTLGIRRREEERVILDRTFFTVETAFGRIRVKVASAQGERLNAMPEYEDCRRAAREHDVALRAVMEAAVAALMESGEKVRS
ncbi:MAG: nickel pincer cofactor biosynthesis protein LarC [Acidobacteriota bacterium]